MLCVCCCHFAAADVIHHDLQQVIMCAILSLTHVGLSLISHVKHVINSLSFPADRDHQKIAPSALTQASFHDVDFCSAVGAGMMLSEGTKPGQLALAVYCQLEADIDDALAAQAVKCLVHLSKDMLAADRTAGLIPTTPAADAEQISASHDQHCVQNHDSGQHQFQSQANGNAQLASAGEQGSAEAADSEDEEKEAGEPDGHQAGLAGAPSLTLQGLVRRMTKMAGDRSVWH